MKARIDLTRCAGCGFCAETLPQVFSMGQYHARVVRAMLSPSEEYSVMQIAEDCPAEAISFEEEDPLPQGSPGDHYHTSYHNKQSR
ncbi:MAG: ferredoxin [Spirochaetales bacterium]|nr:ferredoxin [Spirochaetales bacterium]